MTERLLKLFEDMKYSRNFDYADFTYPVGVCLPDLLLVIWGSIEGFW